MKKILLVSGCSFSDPIFESALHPEMICDWPKWPELVAEELNMQCVNLSTSGSGNEKIYSVISDYLTTPIDKELPFALKRHMIDQNFKLPMPQKKSDIGLVVAAWSQAHRRDWSIKNVMRDKIKKDVWTNMLTDDKGDIYYWFLKSVRYQYAYQNLCKQLEVPYIQFQMISMWRAWVHEIIETWNDSEKEEEHKNRRFWREVKSNLQKHLDDTGYRQLINKKFLGWPGDIKTDNYYEKTSWALSDCLSQEERLSDIDRHPNKQGQEKLANEFLKNLYENKILQKD
jgi:hypothetical protein